MQVDCFPKAPPEWPRRIIGELAKVNPSYKLDKRKAYPFVEMSNVAEHFGGIVAFDERYPESSGLARFKEDDILFGKITPCAENGKVALVQGLQSDFGIGSTEFIVLTPTSENDPRFVYALLCSHTVHGRAVSRMEGSTGRLRITEDTFTKWLVVPRPPRHEQERIAQILDAVDTAITRTRDALAKAERLKRAVLVALLKRGIGSDGRVRAHGDQTEFHDTRLGRLPISWEASNVREEFTLSTGFTLGEHRHPKVNRRKYLRVANVQRGFITLDDVKELEAKDEEMSGRILAKDDLLVVEGHANPKEIGRCARMPDEADGLTFQNHLFRLRPKRLMPEFAELWLNNPWVQRYWQRICASTSGLHTINQRALKALPIVVPLPSEQAAIVSIDKALSANVSCYEAKLEHLTQLKRGLMQDLLTGRVRVVRESPNASKVDGVKKVEETRAHVASVVEPALSRKPRLPSSTMDLLSQIARDVSAADAIMESFHKANAAALQTVNDSVARLIEDASPAHALGKIVEDANGSFLKAIAGVPSANDFIFQELAKSQSWITSFGNLDRMEAAAAAMQAHIDDVTRMSVLAQESWAKVSWGALDDLATAARFPDMSIREQLLSLSHSYTGLQSFVGQRLDFVAAWPPAVTSLPSAEMYHVADLAYVVSVPDEEDTATVDPEVGDELERLLAKLDTGLLQMLYGARSVLSASHHDHVRHFAVSLRELVMHVMHKLAPDEGVKAWSTDPQLFHEGRPTRRARILYISRAIETPETATFLEADVKATLSFVDLFQEGTHAVAPAFSDKQRRAMLIKTEGLLRYLLELANL